MKEFFINLYNNPSFPIYLGAVIGVLVIAFFVVFFLGKKDKENYEKTQRLEAINADAFKETTVPVQMNTAPQIVTEEQKLQDNNQIIQEQPIVSPTIGQPVVEQPQVFEQPVVAPQPQVFEQAVPTPVIEQPVVAPQPQVYEQPAPAPVIEQPVVVQQPVIEQPQVYEQPVVQPEPAPVIEQPVVAPVIEQPQVQQDQVVYPTLNSYETIDAQVDNKINDLQNISNSISNELNSLEAEQEKYRSMASEQPVVQPQPAPVIEQPVVAPVIEQPQVQQPSFNNSNVFSSVYAPQRVEVQVSDDEDEVELPRLK